MDSFLLNADLLETTPLAPPSELAATLSARGLYNSHQFVLRLSPRVHALVDEAVKASAAGKPVSGEAAQAYSTYLHETVHWWQHMGSTSGLILSLVRPAHAHVNQPRLEAIVSRAGGHKSLKRWAEKQAYEGRDHSDPILRDANIAVNNAIDAEFFTTLVWKPPLTAKLQEDRYFESVGHSFSMGYGQAVSLIAATVDPEFEHLPAVARWDGGFQIVRDAGVEGFVWQGDVRVAPLGVHALYEGQARMVQLQFLTIGSAGAPTIAQLRAAGYLDDVYGQAFDFFLTVTRFPEPRVIDDSVVALFLLAVDLAINPTRGFPLEIEDFANFIIDTDPGIRFLRLCQEARDRPELAARITDYSREAYETVSSMLCDACGYDRPATALEQVARWADDVPGLAQIMVEKSNFSFDPTNIVVRVLFSHFVAFSLDKLARPEFFCWPGVWMSGDRASPENLALFLRHLSLYTDQADDDGIYPRAIAGVEPANLLATLNTFYGNIVLYDLTRQWIVAPGPFVYDFSWLTQTHAAADMEVWAKELFANTYGAHPDGFHHD